MPETSGCKSALLYFERASLGLFSELLTDRWPQETEPVVMAAIKNKVNRDFMFCCLPNVRIL